MAIDALPADGPALIGPVPLPSGKRIAAGHADGEPVAWATSEPVPDAGLAWQALSAVHLETGLVPILISGLDDHGTRPWDDGDFGGPADLDQLGRIDAAVVLGNAWGDAKPGTEDEEGDRHLADRRAPFGRTFPGLAPAENDEITAAELHEVLTALPPRRLALVPADRPADVLALLGWNGAVSSWDDPTPPAAVLRSWEARFGARLLEVGFRSISVLASRPPRDLSAAQLVAAEHQAFCDRCGNGLVSIADIGARILSSPVWSFSWD